MAVSTLMNTTWVFNNQISGMSSAWTQSGSQRWTAYLNFNSNNNSFTNMLYEDGASVMSYGTSTSVYATESNTWYNEAYKTVTITGGDNVTDPTLISWFEANATQQETPVAQSDYLEIYSNDERATHYKIYANGICVATIARVNIIQEGSEITVLSAPATQSGVEVTLG